MADPATILIATLCLISNPSSCVNTPVATVEKRLTKQECMSLMQIAANRIASGGKLFMVMGQCYTKAKKPSIGI